MSLICEDKFVAVMEMVCEAGKIMPYPQIFLALHTRLPYPTQDVGMRRSGLYHWIVILNV